MTIPPTRTLGPCRPIRFGVLGVATILLPWMTLACGGSSYQREAIVGQPPVDDSGGTSGRSPGTSGGESGSGGLGTSVDPTGSGGNTQLPGSGGVTPSSSTGGTLGQASGGSSVSSGFSSGGNGSSVSSGGAPGTGGGSGGQLGLGGAATGGAQSGGATAIGTGGAGTGGDGTGGARTGGTTGTGTGGATAMADAARYTFEASTQSWGMASGSDPFTSVARSTAQHFAGVAALAGTVSAAAGKTYILEVAPPSPAIPAGATVTFNVYVPAVAQLSWVQPYVLNDAYKFLGASTSSSSLTKDGWTTIRLAVPSTETNVIRLGVQFASSGSWTGTVYVDSIDW
jgi:hypothetical protein